MFKKLNKRSENLTLMDVKLTQLASFFVAIIAVKLIPELSKTNYLVLILLTIVCLAKPFYSFWVKK